MTDTPLRVTVWNEFVHERSHEAVRSIYPEGMHRTIAGALKSRLGQAVQVRTATLDEPDHGLSEKTLAETDVLTWWGHAAHDQVSDEVVARVHQRVLEGMGLIAIHPAHASKIFTRIMGTSCMLRWREAGERERLWVVRPGHPILLGIDDEYFELPNTEMYGEFFDIPTPDDLLLISWFEGGEVFRSACTFHHGKGKVFYFQPGRKTLPIYHDANVQRIIANSVLWAAPSAARYTRQARHVPDPLSPIQSTPPNDPSLDK